MILLVNMRGLHVPCHFCVSIARFVGAVNFGAHVLGGLNDDYAPMIDFIRMYSTIHCIDLCTNAAYMLH